MKIKRQKKGFTIVELVIVIAVIAVLSAILIPTFAGLVRKAKVASDTALVKDLNTALSIDKSLNGKNATMHDALEATKESGLDVSKLNAKIAKNEIMWDSANDVFCYLDDGKIKYVPDTNLEVKAKDVKAYQYFVIRDVKAQSDISADYSTYLRSSTLTEISTTKGLDVGEITTITTITYTNTSDAQDVVIRTNSVNTNLTINAASDTVNHYGNVGKVDVQKVDVDCYNEHGTAAYVKVTEGKVVVKNGGQIEVVFANNTDASKVAVVQENGGIVAQGFTTATSSGSSNVTLTQKTEAEVEEIAQEAINTAIESTVFAGVAITKTGEATQLMTLEAFRDSVNAGNSYAGYTVKLLNNVDLAGVNWTPIGTANKPFSGVFDGQGNTIKNFKITGEGKDVGLALFGYIEGNASEFTYETSLTNYYNSTTYSVNLPNEEVFTCVIKNLTVSGADVNTTADGWTAGVVAYIKNATVSNVHLSNSTIIANAKVGGIVGFLPDNYAAYITNCITLSGVSIEAKTGNHSAGILARINGDSSRGIIANCTNNATINCAGVNGGGIAGQAKNVLYYNNTNNGSVTGNTRAAGIATDCSGSVFINCTNNGYIKTTAEYSNIYGTDSSAGIAAYLATSGNNVIVNCHNSGTIEGNAPDDKNRIAGIVAGGVNKNDKIINNSNTGTLINHAENGKVYDICNLSSVASEVLPSNLSGLKDETAKDNKYIKVNSSLVLSENDNTVTFNGQEKLEFVNSPKYLTLDLSGANKSSFVLVVNDTEVTLINGGENYVTIFGKGNTVKVDENETVKYLTVLNDDTQSASSFNILGNATKLVLKGNGLVNGEIAENATVERVVFSGNGTFVLTNRGTISHETEGEYGAEHTIDTINSCNITIHNYGTIEAKKNESDVASYALLFFNGATVKLYAYNGSNIIAEGNKSVIITSGGTQVNVYYQDGAEVTSYDSQSTYPSAFGYSCTVTKMN